MSPYEQSFAETAATLSSVLHNASELIHAKR